MGLLAVPRLKQGGAAAGLGKNAKNKVGGQSWERGGEGEDDDDNEDDEDDEGDHPQFGGAAAGSEDEEEDEGEEDEEEDEEDEDGELVLRPKVRKGTPRDRLVRLLERSKADKAEKRSGAGGKKPTAAAAGAAAAAAAAGEADLFTVKRRILPEDEDEGEMAGAAGAGTAAGGGGGVDAPPRKQKLKIRKGGTVAGAGTRTLFDDEGRPVEALEVDFEGVAAEKSGLPQQPEDRVASVRATLQAAKTADRERERARVRDLHKSQKRKRKQEEGDEAGEAPQLSATLGEEGDEGDEGDEAEREPAPRRRKGAASATAGPASLQNDEDRAQAMLAKLLG